MSASVQGQEDARKRFDQAMVLFASEVSHAQLPRGMWASYERRLRRFDIGTTESALFLSTCFYRNRLPTAAEVESVAGLLVTYGFRAVEKAGREWEAGVKEEDGGGAYYPSPPRLLAAVRYAFRQVGNPDVDVAGQLLARNENEEKDEAVNDPEFAAAVAAGATPREAAMARINKLYGGMEMDKGDA